jgi:hypothetical protein
MEKNKYRIKVETNNSRYGFKLKKRDLAKSTYWLDYLGMDIDVTLVARSALIRYDELDKNSLIEFVDGVNDIASLRKKLRRKNLPVWSKFVASELISAISKYKPDKMTMSLAFKKLNDRLLSNTINTDPAEWE